jgi:hypothetical protein
MSCAVFTFLGMAILATNATNERALRATFVAAALMFLVASFMAWRDEYQARVSAEAQLASSGMHSGIEVEIEGAKADLISSDVMDKLSFQMIAFLRFTNHDVAHTRKVARILVEVHDGKQIVERFASPFLKVQYKEIGLGENDAFPLAPSTHREEVRISTFGHNTWIAKSSRAATYRTYVVIEIIGQRNIVEEIATNLKDVD